MWGQYPKVGSDRTALKTSSCLPCFLIETSFQWRDQCSFWDSGNKLIQIRTLTQWPDSEWLEAILSKRLHRSHFSATADSTHNVVKSVQNMLLGKLATWDHKSRIHILSEETQYDSNISWRIWNKTKMHNVGFLSGILWGYLGEVIFLWSLHEYRIWG